MGDVEGERDVLCTRVYHWLRWLAGWFYCRLLTVLGLYCNSFYSEASTHDMTHAAAKTRQGIAAKTCAENWC